MRYWDSYGHLSSDAWFTSDEGKSYLEDEKFQDFCDAMLDFENGFQDGLIMIMDRQMKELSHVI